MKQSSAAAYSRGAVLVTGAASGIGHACALHLDRLGFHVYAGLRQPEAGDALQRAAAGRVTPVILDVTDAASIAAAAGALDSAGGLAGLVNNAGVTVPGPLEFIPLDEFRSQLEVNLVGQLAVTQAVLPLLRVTQGRIVNVGSLSGRVAPPFYGAYAASKFALEALTDALRVELRPWHVQVVLVEPGAVATGIWNKALGAADAWMQRTPGARRLYGRAMVGVAANARRLEAASRPPREVAEAVGHALTTGRPKARYRVAQTTHTYALRLLPLLPAGLRDGLLASTLPKYP